MNFPKALGSDVATTINMSRQGIISTDQILFYFRQSKQHISGNVDQPILRLEAIKQLFEWLINYSFPTPTNKYEEYYSSKITRKDWEEKQFFDYFNLVLKHYPISFIFTKPVRQYVPSLRMRITFSLRKIKSKILSIFNH